MVKNSNSINLIRQFVKDETGQSAAEYALLFCFVGVIAFFVYNLFFAGNGGVLEVYNQLITGYVDLPIP